MSKGEQRGLLPAASFEAKAQGRPDCHLHLGFLSSLASILPAPASPRLDQRHDGVADQRKAHDDHGGGDGVRTCHASPVCCKVAVLLNNSGKLASGQGVSARPLHP